MAENLTAAERLSQIGDEIVIHLVEWTKMLPFYDELPVEIHTHRKSFFKPYYNGMCLVLTQRWAELVKYFSFFNLS